MDCVAREGKGLTKVTCSTEIGFRPAPFRPEGFRRPRLDTLSDTGDNLPVDTSRGLEGLPPQIFKGCKEHPKNQICQSQPLEGVLCRFIHAALSAPSQSLKVQASPRLPH